MLKHWIPWKFLVQRAARSYGVIDPIDLLARMRRFAQPSEIQEPIELLRAGIIFHARGLINTRAIQHNLDWVWPYWVEKQFNPADAAFMPRGFTFSHVNLTHRNWTAVGRPDLPLYPIVDPRGLVTPLYDGWSLDFWIISADDRKMLPSKLSTVDQQLALDPRPAVRTVSRQNGLHLTVEVTLEDRGNIPSLISKVVGRSENGGWLAVALRPYNPEGIQFIETIVYDPQRPQWRVNGETDVIMSDAPAQVLFSDYRDGDVIHKIGEAQTALHGHCEAMAAGKAVVALDASGVRDVLKDGQNGRLLPADASRQKFADAIEEFFQNSKIADRWRRRSRETAQNLSRQICARKLESLYRAVLGEQDASTVQKAPAELIPWDSLLEGLKLEWELLSQKTSAAVDAIRAKYAQADKKQAGESAEEHS